MAALQGNGNGLHREFGRIPSAIHRTPRRPRVGVSHRERAGFATATDWTGQDGPQAQGVPSEPAGIGVYQGRLQSEATAVRIAVDAINLDGGGSTAMTVGGALASSPSDATGERPVGDALLVADR